MIFEIVESKYKILDYELHVYNIKFCISNCTSKIQYQKILYFKLYFQNTISNLYSELYNLK